MIVNAILIHAKAPAATPQTDVGQPALPTEARAELRGELVRNGRAAERMLAGIVDQVEWHFLTCPGHGVDEGDRLTVEYAVSAERGTRFRVLSILRTAEGESEDRILLDRQVDAS